MDSNMPFEMVTKRNANNKNRSSSHTGINLHALPKVILGDHIDIYCAVEKLHFSGLTTSQSVPTIRRCEGNIYQHNAIVAICIDGDLELDTLILLVISIDFKLKTIFFLNIYF